MPDISAETADTRAHEFADQNTALSRCYGQIGIPAVAAAVRYQGLAKNQAYEPAPLKPPSAARQRLS